MTAKTERARLLLKPFGLEDLEYRFRAILQPRLVRFDDAKEELLGALSERIALLRRRLELARRGLEAGSPRAILERGFSVVIHGKTGRVVRRAGETGPGDTLFIRPLEGLITVKTESAAEGKELPGGA
jgi:exodeoxyribonuclease VII large subunit